MATVTKSLAGYGLGAFIGDALNIGFTVSSYKDSREQGDSRAVALTKSAGSFLAGEVFYSSMNKYIGSKAGAALGGSMAKLATKMGGTGAIAGTAGNMLGSFGVMALYSMGQAAVQMGGAAQLNTAQKMSQAYSSKGKFGSGHFDMSEAGYTMRQRSLNAIRSNGLNTQSAIGNEARTYYRSVT